MKAPALAAQLVQRLESIVEESLASFPDDIKRKRFIESAQVFIAINTKQAFKWIKYAIDANLLTELHYAMVLVNDIFNGENSNEVKLIAFNHLNLLLQGYNLEIVKTTDLDSRGQILREAREKALQFFRSDLNAAKESLQVLHYLNTSENELQEYIGKQNEKADSIANEVFYKTGLWQDKMKGTSETHDDMHSLVLKEILKVPLDQEEREDLLHEVENLLPNEYFLFPVNKIRYGLTLPDGSIGLSAHLFDIEDSIGCCVVIMFLLIHELSHRKKAKRAFLPETPKVFKKIQRDCETGELMEKVAFSKIVGLSALECNDTLACEIMDCKFQSEDEWKDIQQRLPDFNSFPCLTMKEPTQDDIKDLHKSKISPQATGIKKLKINPTCGPKIPRVVPKLSLKKPYIS